jgi:hypothetical protein
MEELWEGCESYPWEDVLLEVARLSRTGELRIIYKQCGEYAIRLLSNKTVLEFEGRRFGFFRC